MRAERELLMNERNAMVARIERRSGRVRLAMNHYAASIRLNGASEDIHQSAFARAVLANQRMDFAMLQSEAHAIERHGRPETFADSFQFKYRRVHVRMLNRHFS